MREGAAVERNRLPVQGMQHAAFPSLHCAVIPTSLLPCLYLAVALCRDLHLPVLGCFLLSTFSHSLPSQHTQCTAIQEDGQHDSAIRTMTEHTVAFQQELFLDCVQKVRTQGCACALYIIIFLFILFSHYPLYYSCHNLFFPLLPAR